MSTPNDDYDRLESSIPGTSTPMVHAAAEMLRERVRQDAKWGEQNHPDGTGRRCDQVSAHAQREACERAFREGWGSWSSILRAEVAEAFAESDPTLLRAELIQVAAVAVAWAEAIDRREGGGGRG